MTKRDIAILALRLFCGFLLYQAIMHSDLVAAGLMQFFEDYGENRSVTERIMVFIASFLPFCLFIGSGLAIWRNSPKVADHILRGVDNEHRAAEDKAFSMSIQTIEQAGCSIFGIYLLVDAVPRFAYSLTIVILAWGTPAENILSSVQVRAQLAASTASILLAATLIASGRTVLRLVGRLRYVIHHTRRH